MELEDRKRKEIEHSDHRRSVVRAFEYNTDTSPDQLEAQYIKRKKEYERNFSNMKFYSITRASFAYRDKLLIDRVRGAVVLDYCCGNGEVAIEMAKHGALKVIGIDISPVAIKNAHKLARSVGVETICEFKVMDAEHTEFADGTFDLIHEYGALHHLDLQAAFKELARILKSNGSIVCTEALRHNPLIHWYRKHTPHLRTDWEVEHILGIPEIKAGKNYFTSVDLRTFHLTALLAVPFRKLFFFKPLLSLLNNLDRILLTIPYINWMAWIAVVEFNKSIKVK